MKKLTVLLPDNTEGLDLAPLLALSLDFRIEHVPEAPAAPEKAKRRPRLRGVDTGTVVMKHYTPAGEFSLETATKWLAAEGYSQTSTSPALSKLVKAGRLSRLNDGRWRFITQVGVAAVNNGAR